MDPSEQSLTEFRELINEQLKRPRYDSYDVVHVLCLYWEAAPHNYRDESRKLQDFFETRFGFTDKEEFPIPSENSHLELSSRIAQSIIKINGLLKEQRHGLLIIHYGGHGDQDADKAKGQKRRSVWAAFPEGGPKVQWFEIQPDLKRAKADVFLILDCCFAAQVMRGLMGYEDEIMRCRQEDIENENMIEILAAASMEGRTFIPGPNSFTTAFMKECDEILKKQSYVLVSELVHRLGNRDLGNSQVKMIDLPVVINPLPTTTKLQRLSRYRTGEDQASTKMVVEVDIYNLHFEESFQARVNSMKEWLAKNVPSYVSQITVSRIIHATRDSAQLVESLKDPSSPISSTVKDNCRENIVQAWEKVLALVAMEQDSRSIQELEVVRARALSLLTTLDSSVQKFLETVADEIEPETKSFQSLRTDNTQPDIHILGPLLLKRMIQKCKVPEISPSCTGSAIPDTAELLEFKDYAQGQAQEDVEESMRRIKLLAGVLSSRKPLGFQTLPFRSWDHEPNNHRFVLKFEIPAGYSTKSWTSLYEAIRSTRKSGRPALDERWEIALNIATAISQWHQASWVHQNINSHDIMFFYREGESRLDYSTPYLGGFEYARPSQAPSHGRFVENFERDVYRHPERQGPARKGHRKRHDLYSLGVVLLEIGMWLEATQIADIRSKKQEITPTKLKERLVEEAKERTPFYASIPFAEAVLRCLNNDFEVTMDDEEERGLDRAFKCLVVDRLQEGIHPQTRVRSI